MSLVVDCGRVAMVTTLQAGTCIGEEFNECQTK